MPGVLRLSAARQYTVGTGQGCGGTVLSAVYSEKISPSMRRALAASWSSLPQRVGTGGEGLPEGPAAPELPRRLTDRQPLPERLPAFGGQQCPCDCQVTGRVADNHINLCEPRQGPR